MRPDDTFHLGIRVPDLRAAMEEIGERMGITWAAVRFSSEQTLWTPDGGLQHLALTYTYSAEGPLHLELLEGPPGSVWDGREAPGAHHLGVWSDDVAGETDALVAQGWRVVGAHRDPSEGGGYGVFTYVQPPSGLIVELVDRVVLPHFEQWWSDALT
jgi:lactoylglutathione lyase